MANHSSKTASSTKKKKAQEPLKVAYLLILVAYGFVPVFTPNMETMDSIGPKFLALALLNFVTFIFLFSRKEFKNKSDWYYAFFRNEIGMAYCGLMIISLLSFIKATNVIESVLTFSKFFTTFSAAYLISILFISDKRNVAYLSISMTILLFIDSFFVFSHIYEFIQGEMGISDIKFVYGNKNMLASAIFVKIPFALWLLIYRQNWTKSLGIIGTFLSITAIFFLSARTFYLGIIVLSVLMILFFIHRYTRTRDNFHLKTGSIYLVILVSAFLVFTLTQRYLYPSTGDGYSTSVASRLATITAPDGGGGRLDAWKRSWHAWKENPVLGVGLGNWKIATLAIENKESADLVFLVHAHNDFLQTATETGILGGLLFISIFLLTGLVFLRILTIGFTIEKLQLFFIPAFGLFCYSIDSFFNFPQDRPEMQALFALHVGLAIAFFHFFDEAYLIQKSNKLNLLTKKFNLISAQNSFPSILIRQFIERFKAKFLTPSLGIVFIGFAYILYLNFISLKYQLLVRRDEIDGKLTHPASMILSGFPLIPNLTVDGEPIAVQKSKYLMNENRNEEAISLLKNDHSNPYHPLREYYITVAYHNQKNTDSSFVHERKLYEMKPYFFKNISNLCNSFLQKNRGQEGEVVIDKYLSKLKNNQEAWLYASAYYFKSGNFQKASTVLDSAAHYFPTDSLIFKQKVELKRNSVILRNKILIDNANKAYAEKNYSIANHLYTELLMKEPNFKEVLVYRAFCWYNMKEYMKSIQDINDLISSKSYYIKTYNLNNLLGTNYYLLGKKTEACKNFKIAAELGDKDGINNYAKLCNTAR